jgi:membrane AbrB-like protein
MTTPTLWNTLPRWAALVALSAVLTTGLEVLHLPAALLLGPMAAAIVLAVRGAGLELPAVGMTLAQGVVGLMIATVLPASLLAEVAARWPVVVAGTLATLVASAALGWGLARSGVLPGTTAIWGSMPGAASVMTVVSESYGADIRLVAFMQYLRVACVALSSAIVARLFGVHHMAAAATAWFPAQPATGIAVTLGLTAALAIGGVWLRLSGGAFLLPMFGGMALVQSGLVQIYLILLPNAV